MSENLKNFANEIINHASDGMDLDGGEIQEIAVKHGLLYPITVNSKCGDNCPCSEVSDFPLTCYRKSLELL